MALRISSLPYRIVQQVDKLCALNKRAALFPIPVATMFPISSSDSERITQILGMP